MYSRWAIFVLAALAHLETCLALSSIASHSSVVIPMHSGVASQSQSALSSASSQQPASSALPQLVPFTDKDPIDLVIVTGSGSKHVSPDQDEHVKDGKWKDDEMAELEWRGYNWKKDAE